MSYTTTILVVDDNPPMTKSLADILALKGYVVLTAQGGAEALEILRKQPVDILLTDVVMPGMDGVTLYRQAREILPRLTAFLMTAYATDDLIDQGMAEGIRTVLTKPIDINFFLSLIAAVEHSYIHRR